MPAMKAAFITIGQSPRRDIMPDMLAAIGRDIEVVEAGCLDGLTTAEIAAGAPTDPAQECLVSCLTDGTEVVIEKDWTTARLKNLVAGFDAEDGIDLIVLLCTGYFEGGFFGQIVGGTATAGRCDR